MDESDADLVERTRAGDKAAFGALVDRHRPMAVRLAWRLLESRVDAEDVVQEACLQAFLGLDRLRAPERFGAWLGGMAINLARMRVRARRVAYSLDEWVGGGVAKGFTWAEMQPTPEASYEALELHHLVLNAIGGLPVAQQDAVHQHYWEGLSIVDISLITGEPAGTVRARLSRARQRLRTGLALELGRQPGSTNSTNKEPKMIEVDVYDIVSRLPQNITPETLGGLKPSVILQSCVVLLKAHAFDRMLAITVGPVERDVMLVLLLQKQTLRPLTFEFFARVLEVAGATLMRVAVTRLHEDMFYATAWFKTADGQTHEIDTRPSDAITMAIRVKAPIFVDEALLDQAGIEAANTDSYLDERRRTDQEEGKPANDDVELEWMSILKLAQAA